MIVIGFIGVFLLVLAISFGINWLITDFAILPLADAIWGIDLPFWPVFIITCIITSIITAAVSR